MTGDLYRLRNPYQDGAFAQIVVAEDKSRAVFLYVRESSVLNGQKEERLRLKGLEENAKYVVEETGEIFTAKSLLKVGLDIELKRMDYSSIVLHLSKVK